MIKGNRIKRFSNRLMIYLSKGKVALADLSDEKAILQYTWCALGPFGQKFYAKTTVCSKGQKKALKLHYLLMPKIDGMMCDHINGNSLDNRRHNLRYANHLGNAQNNTSKYRGVHFIKHLKSKPWKAVIGVNREVLFLGHFKTKEEAMDARLLAEKRYFGEFAPKE